MGRIRAAHFLTFESFLKLIVSLKLSVDYDKILFRLAYFLEIGFRERNLKAYVARQ